MFADRQMCFLRPVRNVWSSSSFRFPVRSAAASRSSVPLGFPTAPDRRWIIPDARRRRSEIGEICFSNSDRICGFWRGAGCALLSRKRDAWVIGILGWVKTLGGPYSPHFICFFFSSLHYAFSPIIKPMSKKLSNLEGSLAG